eukprot:5485452-Pyramimonas_sp.AAC.1
MQQCFAPRILGESGHSSLPIQPQKATVAGLRSAVDLSRCILYRTLERMREGHTPVTIKSWVDDLNARIIGPPKFAVDQITKVATILRDGCKELDLIISPESNILSSSVLAGVALEANLKQLGLT